MLVTMISFCYNEQKEVSMNFRETREALVDHTTEPEQVSVQHHATSAADHTTGPGEDIYPGTVTHAESAGAVHGQAGATHGHQQLGSFLPSNGMHSVGSDHIGCFSGAIRMSGGVRQGQQFTSDPAPGVARAGVDGFTPKYEQDPPRGAGKTFEDRQHSRWAGQGG